VQPTPVYIEKAQAAPEYDLEFERDETGTVTKVNKVPRKAV
jgi:hypothetical protein